MIDENGNTPDMDDFYCLDAKTWVERGHSNSGWIYQKIADGQLMPVMVASGNRLNSLIYEQFCEISDGRPYSQIVSDFSRGMA